jgi:hypothetical protein
LNTSVPEKVPSLDLEFENIILGLFTKSKRMRWTGDVAGMGLRGMHIGY